MEPLGALGLGAVVDEVGGAVAVAQVSTGLAEGVGQVGRLVFVVRHQAGLVGVAGELAHEPHRLVPLALWVATERGGVIESLFGAGTIDELAATGDFEVAGEEQLVELGRGDPAIVSTQVVADSPGRVVVGELGELPGGQLNRAR